MNVINDLYHGNINPLEFPVPNLPEYKEALSHIIEVYDKLKNILNKDDFDKVDELYECYSELYCIEKEQMFKYGFKLGMLLAFEVTQE